MNSCTARAELEKVQRRLADRETVVKAVVRDELESAQRTLAEMDRNHRESLDMIRSAAEAEAARIIADAAVGAVAGTVEPTPGTTTATNDGV